jgi:hypothetical protein
MSLSHTYGSARAFRQALEARLKRLAEEENVDIQRLRRRVAFDRLLVRLFSDSTRGWALKGGYALELRIAAARATRDIDLTLVLRNNPSDRYFACPDGSRYSLRGTTQVRSQVEITSHRSFHWPGI